MSTVNSVRIPSVSNIVHDLISSFLDAAGSGELQKVRNFINQGMPINIQNSDGCTALYRAAAYGRIEVVRYLVGRKGINLNIECEGITPLEIAVINGHLTVSKLLGNDNLCTGNARREEVQVEEGTSSSYSNEVQAKKRKRSKEQMPEEQPLKRSRTDSYEYDEGISQLASEGTSSTSSSTSGSKSVAQIFREIIGEALREESSRQGHSHSSFSEEQNKKTSQIYSHGSTSTSTSIAFPEPVSFWDQKITDEDIETKQLLVCKPRGSLRVDLKSTVILNRFSFLLINV